MANTRIGTPRKYVAPVFGVNALAASDVEIVGALFGQRHVSNLTAIKYAV